MKYVLLVLLGLIGFTNTYSQNRDSENKVFVLEEGVINAEAPGGINGFYEYVKANLKYPKKARRKGVEGRVFVSFIIEKDGTITNIEIVKGIGEGCDEEVIRIIQNSPKWKPGYKDNQPVRVRMTIPIQFTLR